LDKYGVWRQENYTKGTFQLEKQQMEKEKEKNHMTGLRFRQGKPTSEKQTFRKPKGAKPLI